MLPWLILFALIVVLALRAASRMKALDARVKSLEAEVAYLRAPFTAPLPPVAELSPSVEPSPVAEAPVPDPEEPRAGPAPWGRARAVSVPPVAPFADPVPPAPADPVGPPPVPPRAVGLEERLGARWAVWVGGLALALGGLFLVRVSIEAGLFGPGARVILGLLFAAALVAAGEWLRRRPDVPSVGPASVPAILTAAGVSTAFAATYAAYGLYGLIGPLPAFIVLAAFAFAAMAASALHGPALAALGLVGALAAPALVASETPNLFALALYLVAVSAAAYAVARLRLYRWLALSAAIGACLWGLVIVVGDGLASAAFHILAQTALAIVFLVAEPHRATPDEAARTDRFASAILLGLGLLAILFTANLGLGGARPVFAAAMAAMLLATAWRFPAAAPAAPIAAFVLVGILGLWPVAGEAGAEPRTVVAYFSGSGSPLPQAVALFLATALAGAAALVACGLGRVLRGPTLRLPPAALLVGAATIGPLAILVVAYLRIAEFERSIPFALVAAAGAAGFAGAARLLAERGGTESSGALRLALGGTAAAAVAALALGLVFWLDRGALTVALALAALGTAFVADRVQVPALRLVVGALGIVVAARLAWDPRIVGADLGRTPIVNWLLWGYGVPALAFGLAARIMARQGRDRPVRVAETLAVLFSALLVFLEIRHALHDGDIYAAQSGHLEAGLVTTQGLGFSLLMARLGSRDADPLYRFASLGFAALALATAALALLLSENPYLTGERIAGGALLNTLAPAYVLPAAMAAGLAAASRAAHPRAFVLAAAALALVLELAFAGLEIRRLFQGPAIGWQRWTGEGEFWAYSAVLLANGVALLAAGLRLGIREARLAGAACLALAVGKVFLVDLANLQGVMRALSFVGLGLVLVGTGFAYQRLGRRP